MSSALILTIAMIATFALAAGGIWTIVRQHDRKRGILMLIAAAVVLGDVLIWTWP
jgi:hypothetical protein